MEVISVIIDFILHIDVHLNELVTHYGGWVYLVLFFIIFCETGLVVIPFLPGDSLLFMAGAISALPGNPMNIHVLTSVLVVAAIAGDTLNYFIGRISGKKLFSRSCSKIFRRSYLHKTEDFFEHHGGKTIIVARFVPIIRTFAPFVAGMGHMPYRKFTVFNIAGAFIWVITLSWAGYLFGNLPFIRHHISELIILILLLSILPAVIGLIRQRIKK